MIFYDEMYGLDAKQTKALAHYEA
ncbi:MAG: hypothetical protein RLY95_1797, partial [Pseudomonadota bacterium]